MTTSPLLEEMGRHRRIRGRDFNHNDLAAAALPYMSRMRHHVPGIHAVVLGTGDGIHVCSVGLDDALDAARITALNSSMLGVSSAQAQVIDPLKEEDRDTIVTVAMPGDEYMSLAKIEHAPVGHLVLSLFARDTQLGMVVHQTRQAAASLTEWLLEE
ncbi:MAG: hypothetical protein Q4G50_10650 [Corynebacterium sp.]|uniref:hypothetical protein n=1 Tax=Corynebacterium sp. TaxID=1720 RepID=UPI0026DEC55B|nr:hypothetical protein [Corynebacterium sp.]MDO5670454.1 hypothetical protein [Corynebacterium sp.]